MLLEGRLLMALCMGAVSVCMGAVLMWYSLGDQLNGTNELGRIRRILRGTIIPFARTNNVCFEKGSGPIETPNSALGMCFVGKLC
jgi:hypothetical protein